MAVEVRLIDVSDGPPGEWWGEYVFADDMGADHHLSLRMSDDELNELEFSHIPWPPTLDDLLHEQPTGVEVRLG